jgi:hypothetical protein
VLLWAIKTGVWQMANLFSPYILMPTNDQLFIYGQVPLVYHIYQGASFYAGIKKA